MKRDELEKINHLYSVKLKGHFNGGLSMVFGDGNADSEIVLVGEAPGKTEVEKGKPFVGQAGKNLQEFIDILGIGREDLYITNVVKFRPYVTNPDTGRESNRTPSKEEIEISMDFIERELSIIKPKLVVSLGNIALRCILRDDKATIGVLHGRPLNVVFSESRFVLFPLYHPASIIYRRELKFTYTEDLRKLKEYMISKHLT